MMGLIDCASAAELNAKSASTTAEIILRISTISNFPGLLRHRNFALFDPRRFCTAGIGIACRRRLLAAGADLAIKARRGAGDAFDVADVVFCHGGLLLWWGEI